MKFLKESKEYFQSKLRPISKTEHDYVKKFIELMEITFAFSKEKKITEKELDEFLHKIHPFLKYPFAHSLKNFSNEVKKHKEDLTAAGDQDQHIDSYLKTHEEIMSALRSNDLAKAIQLNDPNRLDFLKKLDTHRKGIVHFARSRFSNPFKFESNFLFYNKDALIDNFDHKNLDELKNAYEHNHWTDYSKSLTSISDPASLIFAVQNFKKGDKGKVRVERNVQDWLRFNLKDDEKYKKVLELVNNILYSNDKTKLKEVMTFVNSVPMLKTANEKLKKSIKTVYRGVGLREGDSIRQDEIIDLDKKQEFVSTSTSKRSAKNFALGIGHLESPDSRRSKEAVIIEYEVDQNSIILCVEIFGSVFGEREVLIDTKKVKSASLEWI